MKNKAAHRTILGETTTIHEWLHPRNEFGKALPSSKMCTHTPSPKSRERETNHLDEEEEGEASSLGRISWSIAEEDLPVSSPFSVPTFSSEPNHATRHAPVPRLSDAPMPTLAERWGAEMSLRYDCRIEGWPRGDIVRGFVGKKG